MGLALCALMCGATEVREASEAGPGRPIDAVGTPSRQSPETTLAGSWLGAWTVDPAARGALSPGVSATGPLFFKFNATGSRCVYAEHDAAPQDPIPARVAPVDETGGAARGSAGADAGADAGMDANGAPWVEEAGVFTLRVRDVYAWQPLERVYRCRVTGEGREQRLQGTWSDTDGLSGTFEALRVESRKRALGADDLAGVWTGAWPAPAGKTRPGVLVEIREERQIFGGFVGSHRIRKGTANDVEIRDASSGRTTLFFEIDRELDGLREVVELQITIDPVRGEARGYAFEVLAGRLTPVTLTRRQPVLVQAGRGGNKSGLWLAER